VFFLGFYRYSVNKDFTTGAVVRAVGTLFHTRIISKIAAATCALGDES